jgi:hypothetical protein
MDDKYRPWIERNYGRARKGGRNDNAQIATVSQGSLENLFPKEVYSAHGVFLMGVQSTKGNQWALR